MSRSNHPIEQEELMAYLDGELATNRAVEAAAHMERCDECQELAADLRELSHELMAWEVEASDIGQVFTELATALEQQEKTPKKNIAAVRRQGWKTLLAPRSLAWAGGMAICLVLIMTAFMRYAAHSSFDRLETFTKLSPAPPSGGPVTSYNGPISAPSAERRAHVSELQDPFGQAEPSVPIIARIAGLMLTTREFDKTRTALEEILKRYSGYLGDLQVSAPADAGRTLTATLRIPAQQLDAAMAELKRLGRVENESQGGEEVTQQYVDLEARLANGKHTEQRLTEILRQRTGKLQDVLKVELEIDRVRGEIEQMQAEKKALSKRVAFATLNMTLQEEYHARLQAAPPSTGSRFRNAAIDGYNTVIEGLINIGLFLLSAGPSLLLWAAILFFPARWTWKRIRKIHQSDTARGE